MRTTHCLFVIWATAAAQGCGPVSNGRVAIARPSAAGPVTTDLCEIEYVSSSREGQVVLTACGRLLAVRADHVTTFEDCSALDPITRLSPDEFVLGGARCDLRTGAFRPLPDEASVVFLRPDSAVYVQRGQQHLRVFTANSEERLEFPEPITSSIASTTTDTVAVLTDDRSSIYAVRLAAPSTRVRIPHRPLPHITDIDWRGDRVLLAMQGGRVMVFDQADLSRPLVERSGLQDLPRATLSPDGHWVFLADTHVVRCLSTDDGTERWWQQISWSGRLGIGHTGGVQAPLLESRWTADGKSIVLRYAERVTRIHAASGDIMASLSLPTAPPAVVSPDGRAVAACVGTLPGHEDTLLLSNLNIEQTDMWEAGVPPRSAHRRTRRRPLARTEVPLPDGSCVLAEMRWLDSDTVAVFNNRLHVVRNAREVLSLGVALGEGRLWAQRDGNPFVRNRVQRLRSEP